MHNSLNTTIRPQSLMWVPKSKDKREASDPLWYNSAQAEGEELLQFVMATNNKRFDLNQCCRSWPMTFHVGQRSKKLIGLLRDRSTETIEYSRMIM